jgi:A/G-specific adenine glycosylase
MTGLVKQTLPVRRGRRGTTYDTKSMPRRCQTIATQAELDRAAVVGASLERWFDSHGRDFPWRGWRDPYRVAITEILLQRTRAQSVANFVPSFFEKYPDALSLSRAPIPELQKALLPIGLQARRARSLVAFGEAMVSDPSAAITSGPGVGQYISRAIAVGVRNSRVAMVDSNFVRMLRRAFSGPWMSDYRFDRRLQSLALAVVDGAGNPRAVNWAVLDLGALVCLPTAPRCGTCPIRDYCVTGIGRTTGGFEPTDILMTVPPPKGMPAGPIRRHAVRAPRPMPRPDARDRASRP